MNQTLAAFDAIIMECQDIFVKKTKDYGTAWRILRPASLTDQIFIKAKRIRNLQSNQEQKVEEGMDVEFIGIINYALMALIQLKHPPVDTEYRIDADQALHWYDEEASGIKQLLERKNHDYGEAWRDMRIASMTDLILMKLLRIKEIEDNAGFTLISEGLDANYQDIINYAVFCLIKLKEHDI
ncbi:MAG TPA: DUF1599 domain-containing protein [Saprospiraceae bacterium]|nr:DUF1599 domain-containing protein [Saprospiraceae bacterium]